MESSTASGLAVIEHRSSRDTSNGIEPSAVPPGTVGPHAEGDDVMIVPPIRPQPWAGWPSDWQTPNWFGQVQQMTDTAWACLDLNASVFASMPPYLVGASPSLAADWVNNPDPEQYDSWSEFGKQLMWDFQLGECFVLATARYNNGTGWPARFHVCPPWTVDAEIDGLGHRRYRIGGKDVTEDMLHVRYQSTTGDARGHGALEAGAARVVAANALARYATNVARAGGAPNSVIKSPRSMTKTQAEDLQRTWVEARMSSMGLPAVLAGGLEFQTVSLSPKDMALVELAQWNESRIAVLLGVPPFLVGLPSGGDSLTYSTTVQLFDYHWRSGLKPKASRLMSALSQWALPRGTAVECNRDEYIRPGPLERAQTAEIWIRTGVFSVEQIQEIERTIGTAVAPPLTSGVLK